MNNNALNKFKTAKQTVVNDTTRRFGYSGGTPHMVMDAAKSGLDCNPIVGGKLLLYVHNPKASGFIGAGVDAYTGERKKQYVPLYPSMFQSVVSKAFHTDNDMGYRNLDMLTKVPYEVGDDYYRDEADEYFAVVHPTLTDCPFGLNKPIQLTDPQAGVSTPVFQFCPTCQLEDLRSQACSDRIFAASQTLDSAILADLRITLTEACEAAILHADNKLQIVMSEIAGRMTGQPGRATLLIIDRIHLRMQHKDELKPEQQGTVDLINQLGKAIATAGAQTVPPVEGKVLSADEAARYDAYLAQQASISPSALAMMDKAQADAQTIVADGGFLIGGYVLCDGAKGQITEVKTAGWYTVTLESGETKTVRKDKLTYQGDNNVSSQD